MATKKITELPAANSVANSDLLVVVTSPSSSATTKKITVQNFLSNVSVNTATVTNTITVAGNGVFQSNVVINNTLLPNNLIIATRATPANSTSTTVQAGIVFYDNNFIYVATANNVVKRASLSTF